jgi:hypothetical protein
MLQPAHVRNTRHAVRSYRWFSATFSYCSSCHNVLQLICISAVLGSLARSINGIRPDDVQAINCTFVVLWMSVSLILLSWCIDLGWVWSCSLMSYANTGNGTHKVRKLWCIISVFHPWLWCTATLATFGRLGNVSVLAHITLTITPNENYSTQWQITLGLLCVGVLIVLCSIVVWDHQVNVRFTLWQVFVRFATMNLIVLFLLSLDCAIQYDFKTDIASLHHTYDFRIHHYQLGMVLFCLFGFSADVHHHHVPKGEISDGWIVFRRSLMIGQGVGLGLWIQGLYMYGNAPCLRRN